MNNITQGDYLVFCSLTIIAALALVIGISAIVRKVKEKKAETFEPRAGKTLGL
jgi:flagellar biogenesis protein FliO